MSARSDLTAEPSLDVPVGAQPNSEGRDRRPFRHVLEYAGMRLGLALVDRLPGSTTARLSTRIADLWFLLDVSRRRTALRNIRQSGVTDDPGRIRRIARESFRHFALVAVESLQGAQLISEANWREFVALHIPPETQALFEAPGRGVILVSGHLGNWEMAAQFLSYVKPVVGVTRAMNNPLTEALIRERKARGQFRLTPKHDADAGRFLTALRNGEMLAMQIDQHAREQGMMIDFFGRPASTHTSPALLHLVTGAPICFGACIRTGLLRFRLEASKPLSHEPTGDREQDVRAILDELTRQLETAIRENPAQYLWAHRRWR
jgi:Kdo2-lipid IVA lauroyltransferase/acyltransferase